MNRVEDLVLNLADGLLSEEEGRELEQLIAEDAHGAQSYVALLELEAALRGGRPELDLTQKTMDRLRASLETEVEAGVMEAIRSGPATRWAKPALSGTDSGDPGALDRLERPRRTGLLAVATSFLAAVVVLGLCLWFWVSPRGVPPGSDTAIASIVRDSPGVVILRGARELSAVAGAHMVSGDQVEVRAAHGAEIEWPNGIRIEIGPHTRIALRPAKAEGEARVALEQGTLRSRGERLPHGGRLVVSTAHAEVEPLGRHLSVAVSRDGTKLDAREGAARLRRLRDDAVVEVPPGYFVVARDSLETLVPRSIHHPEIDIHQLEKEKREHDRHEHRDDAPGNRKKEP